MLLSNFFSFKVQFIKVIFFFSYSLSLELGHDYSTEYRNSHPENNDIMPWLLFLHYVYEAGAGNLS